MKLFTGISAVLLVAACVCIAFSGCSKDQAPSLLLTTETTQKEAFDEEAFREEYERTSVYTPEETTVPQSEEETSAPAQETTVKPDESGTTTLKDVVTELTTLVESTITGSSGTQQETTTAAATSAATTTKLFGRSKKQFTTTTTTQPPTTLRVVDTTSETKEKRSDYKYGVVKIDVTSTYYDILEDGSKVQTNQRKYTKYDSSKYKASTNDLLDESKTNKSKYYSEITAAFNAVNEIRASAGVSKLVLNDDLCTAACVRATEMAYSGNMEHTRPDGTSCETVLSDLGIEWNHRGENVAKGFSTGKEAAKAWEESSSHKKVMVSPEFTDVGIGVAAAPDGTIYWCMILTAKTED